MIYYLLNNTGINATIGLFPYIMNKLISKGELTDTLLNYIQQNKAKGDILNMGNGAHDSREKLYVIPQDEMNRISLLNVDRNTKEDIRKLYRIYIEFDWECNTIATKYIEILLKSLYTHLLNAGTGSLITIPDATSLEVGLQFYDLFDARVTQKRNESADKVGNINISFRPGTAAANIISNDVPRDQRVFDTMKPDARFAFPNNPELSKAMLQIDNIARRELSDKYGIMIAHEWVVTAIAHAFIENLYRELIYKLTLTGKPAVSINFNDIIEYSAAMKDSGAMIYIRPGMESKLIIKSDETTEQDEADDDSMI